MISLYSAAIERWKQRNGYTDVKLRAALIDMDGTLFDSMPRHSQAWERLAAEEGIAVEPGEFFLHEGRTGAATINILFQRTFGRPATPEEQKELYKRKTIYFKELPDVDAMPGAARMLSQLKLAGVTRVLVTGSAQGSLLDRLDAEFPGAFPPDLRITGSDVTHGKPHPEPFLKAMQLAAALPSQSMVIENAPLGVEAGRASGALTVAVNTGPIPAATLEEAGADIVFPSMNHLADAIPLIMAAFR